MESFWLKQAKNTKRRYNFACWLSVWLPIFLVFCCLSAVILLLFRQSGVSTIRFWPIFGFGSICTVILAKFLSRSRYISLEESLVRLETKLGLDARLSSAYAGAGKYPEQAESVSDGATWNFPRITVPLSLALLSLVAAQFFPIKTATSTSIQPEHRPLSVAEAEELLEELEQLEALNPEDIEAFKEQLEQLQDLDPKEWFDENSLEAADSLKEKIEQSADELASEMQRTESLLDDLDSASSATPEDADKSLSELSEALKSMEQGSLKLSPEMSESLSESLRANKDALSKEQREKLKKQLKEARKQLSEALGQKGEQGQNSEGQGKSQSQSGQGECSGDSDGSMCKPGQSSGTGKGKGQDGDKTQNAPGRGGDTAPLNLEERSPQITSNLSEQLNEQKQEFELGGFLGENARSHKDATKGSLPTQSAGTIGKASRGGLAVGRQEYTPQEREILKKYFK